MTPSGGVIPGKELRNNHLINKSLKYNNGIYNKKYNYSRKI